MYQTPENGTTCRYLKEIADTFIAHEKDQDRERLRRSLEVIFAGYAYADAHEQIGLYQAVSVAIERCLGTDTSISEENGFDSPKSLGRDQKLDVILATLTPTPPLFQAAQEAIAHFAREIERNGYEDLYVRNDSDCLIGLKTMWAYPSLRPALQRLALSALDRLESDSNELFLPELLATMEGTDLATLVQDGHVQDYLTHRDDEFGPNDFKILWGVPHVWEIIEKSAPSFFYARAPKSPHLAGGGGCHSY